MVLPKNWEEFHAMLTERYGAEELKSSLIGKGLVTKYDADHVVYLTGTALAIRPMHSKMIWSLIESGVKEGKRHFEFFKNEKGFTVLFMDNAVRLNILPTEGSGVCTVSEWFNAAFEAGVFVGKAS